MDIKIQNISKTYYSKDKKSKRIILDNISLSINQGESISILGPSGSGKTTLLNILGTLDHADKGEILLNDKALSTFSAKDLPAFRNKKIGFIFQKHHLMPQLNMLENVLLPTIALKNTKDKSLKSNALGLLQKLGLEDINLQKPGELSGGECQRTAVARALINKPELVLADEPTGSLDAESAEKVGDLLVHINKEFNVSLVVVTHSQTLANKFNKIYKLTNGKLEQVK